ncbi:cold shock domain-containing protein CspD [Porticoccus sp.]
MPSGTVKWFNNAKGYGFILSADGANDIFAHYSAINMDGYKTLKAGQEVTYDLVEGQKGLHATNIVAASNGEEELEESGSESIDEQESEHS